jgi:signal transduction histidine kinase
VELRLADFDLRRLIEDVALLASPEAARQGVRVETQLTDEPLPVRADSDLIKQALLNVVLNGVQAMSDGGRLSIVAQQYETAATIEVRDEGPGIPPDVRDKVFNLYFTTKKAGSGIGLAMSYRVLQLHNGAIDFRTELGQGTTFRLVLPLAVAKQPESAEAATRA